MKKLFVVLLAALVIALGIWVALRVVEGKRRATVAELLPRNTLLLLQAPDFKKARTEWQGSDLYAIWREPSVQKWLQEPLAKWQKQRGDEESLGEFLALNPTDGFFALTSIENNEPKLVAGFHYEKSQAQAEKFIAQREAAMFGKRAPQRSTITYQQHQIELRKVERFTFAQVFLRKWFLVANDLPTLEALLDRADHRTGSATGSLHDEESFQTATAALPNEFLARFFFAPPAIVEKLLPLIALTGQNASSPQIQALKKIESAAGTFGIQNGKMREAIFLGMPRLSPNQPFARPALATADTATIFYSAALAHWSEGFSQPATAGALPGVLQQFVQAFVRQDLSAADLRAAFGEEFEVLSRWPSTARWPSLVVSLPVKDAARARKIAEAVASVGVAGVPWTHTQKDGADVYDLPSFSGLVPVTLAFAVSEKKLVAGIDAAAVLAAIAPTAAPAEPLEKSEKFRDAVAPLPAADSAFAYLDTRQLFERLDETLRPLLLMSATLSPTLGSRINAAQLPPAADIAKHLSPIVMTQRYNGKGYIRESVGPVTFNEAIVGAAATFGAAYVYLHGGAAKSLLPKTPALNLPAPSAAPATSTPPSSPSATATASGSPF